MFAVDWTLSCTRNLLSQLIKFVRRSGMCLDESLFIHAGPFIETHSVFTEIWYARNFKIWMLFSPLAGNENALTDRL